MSSSQGSVGLRFPQLTIKAQLSDEPHSSLDHTEDGWKLNEHVNK